MLKGVIEENLKMGFWHSRSKKNEELLPARAREGPGKTIPTSLVRAAGVRKVLGGSEPVT